MLIATQLACDDVDLDRAAIAVRDRAAVPGWNSSGPGQGAGRGLSVHDEFERRFQRVLPGRDGVHHARRVTSLKSAVEPMSSEPGAARKQDANTRDRGCAEFRPCEVVEDDLLVVEALLGVPVRAVLAQADAVAPAVAGDHERREPQRNRLCARGRPCVRRRTGDEQQNGDE